MGPYCKFCNNRCFVPTKRDDVVTSDLRATCDEGIKYDLHHEADKIANKLLDNKISIAEAARFLNLISEELEKLK